MNAIDGTDRDVHLSAVTPPSLLTVILDTNPQAWEKLDETDITLSIVIANLLIFINTHLAFSHANKVAILASRPHSVEWLYPTPQILQPTSTANGDIQNGTTDTLRHDANKFPAFARVEHEVIRNIRRLTSSSSIDHQPTTTAGPTSTLIAGALTTALTYISKTTLQYSPTERTDPDPDSTAAAATAFDRGDGTTTSRLPGITARVLVLSVSPDISAQYIPVMNAIFAFQRSAIPIDVLKLAGTTTTFLQQASDATGGVYLEPETPEGLLQYLMLGMMPDPTARALLVLPRSERVDFRAACFCHQKVVSVGWVCSVCLSIFCGPPPDSICLTCGTQLKVPASSLTVPAVIPPRKKKKKKNRNAGEGTGTNTPAGSTPLPS